MLNPTAEDEDIRIFLADLLQIDKDGLAAREDLINQFLQIVDGSTVCFRDAKSMKFLDYGLDVDTVSTNFSEDLHGIIINYYSLFTVFRSYKEKIVVRRNIKSCFYKIRTIKFTENSGQYLMEIVICNVLIGGFQLVYEPDTVMYMNFIQLSPTARSLMLEKNSQYVMKCCMNDLPNSTYANLCSDYDSYDHTTRFKRDEFMSKYCSDDKNHQAKALDFPHRN